MLTKRIIPCLDVAAGRVVKGVQFKNLKEAGSPSQMAAYYCAEGADELAFYDITASIEQRRIDLFTVRQVAGSINVPLCVGGGIQTLADFSAALESGADKISINTAAIRCPDLITQAAKRYGRQCVVLSIDCLRLEEDADSAWQVMTGAGHVREPMDVLVWLEEAAERGAGEVILNAISADGTKAGYDLELLKAARKRVNIPIIASGGAGRAAHMAEAFIQADADGALAASMFHCEGQRIREVKRFLRDQGVEVRLDEFNADNSSRC